MDFEKEKWAQTLKVGDVVNDCRYRNLRIKEIYPVYGHPLWARKIMVLIPLWMPKKLQDAWEDFWYAHLPKSEFWDAELTLEDGAHCSAVHCCDPVMEDE